MEYSMQVGFRRISFATRVIRNCTKYLMPGKIWIYRNKKREQIESFVIVEGMLARD